MEQEKISLRCSSTEGEEVTGSEECDGKGVTPAKDLAAAVGVAGLSLFFMVPVFGMPNPDTIYTHPGLLPFLTGFTLLLMAIGLGVRSIRAGGAKEVLRAPASSVRNYFADAENLRTLLVIGIIIVYVVLVDLVAFDLRLPAGFFVFRFSGYELFSILTLTLILRIFWRATLKRCLLVSTGWIIALVSVFRYAFYILLPGLG